MAYLTTEDAIYNLSVAMGKSIRDNAPVKIDYDSCLEILNRMRALEEDVKFLENQKCRLENERI